MNMITHRWPLALGLSIVLLTGCSDGSDGVPAPPEPPPPVEPDYLPIAQPEVADPPDEGDLFLLSTTFDLADVGYRQREYFLSGEASAFSNLNELGSDGAWEAEPAGTANYRTRVVVYRPIDDGDFSGTVLVEWLNVTAGFDTGPSYGSGHVEMLRQGHVWVGVSAQRVGIEGSGTPVAPLHLKAVNPARYGSLEHPGDSYSYDMFSQAAQALREPADVDLLGAWRPISTPFIRCTTPSMVIWCTAGAMAAHPCHRSLKPRYRHRKVSSFARI